MGTNRLSLKPGGLQALSAGRKHSVSTSSERSSPEGSSAGGAMRRSKSDDREPRVSPVAARQLARRESLALPSSSPKPPARAATMGPTAGGQGPVGASAGAASNAAMARETEDLKSTIKVLEKKRGEDREKLKALERVQAERDKFETIIQKLQGGILLHTIFW